MTERKPRGVSFESWVDQQIREATERGVFDNVPGTGKPIKDLDTPYEQLWVRRILQREGIPTSELLPTPLKLRREISRLPETVRGLRSEQAVRDVVEDLNVRITAWVRRPSEGPRVPVAPVDVDRVLARWRADRRAMRPVEPPTGGGQVPVRRRVGRWRRWLRLLRGDAAQRRAR